TGRAASLDLTQTPNASQYKYWSLPGGNAPQNLGRLIYPGDTSLFSRVRTPASSLMSSGRFNTLRSSSSTNCSTLFDLTPNTQSSSFLLEASRMSQATHRAQTKHKQSLRNTRMFYFHWMAP